MGLLTKFLGQVEVLVALAVAVIPEAAAKAVMPAVELVVAAEPIPEAERTRWPEPAAEPVALVMGMALVKELDRG